MIGRLGRYWRTLRHLRLSQLFWFAWRRALGGASPAPEGGAGPLRRSSGLAIGAPEDETAPGQPYGFHFLNETRVFAPGAMDWCPADMNRLWRYNLHYFEWLDDGWRSLDEKQQLIEDWIHRNPPGSEPAWEPYTASLRICSWVRFFLREYRENPPPQQWLDSLYQQAGWLARNLELHILANHLFENYKALQFAGAYFEGADAARWLRIAERGLLRELPEQSLPDGGHYERAPTYHAALLIGHLQLIECGRALPGSMSAPLLRCLEDVAGRGLAFLARIALPDQSVPLFNDSALGLVPDCDRIIAWGERVLGCSLPPRAATALVDEQDSGIHGIVSGRDMWVVDCGDIGPAYQPGHTHCDFLSYELMLDGRRVVVDTGVNQYEPGEMRHYLRSTRAHNTVSVDGREQSEVWGEFRVGRRAHKRGAGITWGEAGREARFSGAYRGFRGGRRAIEHRREARVALAEGRVQRVSIADHIRGRDWASFESYLHLHPDYHIEPVGPGELLLSADNGPALRLRFDPSLAWRSEDAWYCPEFGLKLRNSRIAFRQSAPHDRIEYSLERC